MTCHAWGWSLDNPTQAREEAVSRARRIFDRLVNGARPDRYEYSTQPPREEIVSAVRQGDKDIAIVTRNRYGALVLNAASVLFVDVDYPKTKAQGLGDAVALLFSRRRREQRKAAARQLTLESVRQWSQQHAHHAFRIYRTCAGLRLGGNLRHASSQRRNHHRSGTARRACLRPHGQRLSLTGHPHGG